jgi:uncharacterized protein YegL
MGFAFSKGKQLLNNVKDYNVLVTIMTDGEENASIEYSGLAIKKMIEELKLKRWTFTYIGTDHDVEKFADSMSISNKMRFEKNAASLNEMFEKEKYAREMYSKKIRDKEETSENYYEEEK